MWIVLAGLTAWGTLSIATGALAELPASALIPLLIWHFDWKQGIAGQQRCLRASASATSDASAR